MNTSSVYFLGLVVALGLLVGCTEPEYGGRGEVIGDTPMDVSDDGANAGTGDEVVEPLMGDATHALEFDASLEPVWSKAISYVAAGRNIVDIVGIEEDASGNTWVALNSNSGLLVGDTEVAAPEHGFQIGTLLVIAPDGEVIHQDQFEQSITRWTDATPITSLTRGGEGILITISHAGRLNLPNGDSTEGVMLGELPAQVAVYYGADNQIAWHTSITEFGAINSGRETDAGWVLAGSRGAVMLDKRGEVVWGHPIGPEVYAILGAGDITSPIDGTIYVSFTHYDVFELGDVVAPINGEPGEVLAISILSIDLATGDVLGVRMRQDIDFIGGPSDSKPIFSSTAHGQLVRWSDNYNLRGEDVTPSGRLEGYGVNDAPAWSRTFTWNDAPVTLAQVEELETGEMVGLMHPLDGSGFSAIVVMDPMDGFAPTRTIEVDAYIGPVRPVEGGYVFGARPFGENRDVLGVDADDAVMMLMRGKLLE